MAALLCHGHAFACSVTISNEHIPRNAGGSCRVVEDDFRRGLWFETGDALRLPGGVVQQLKDETIVATGEIDEVGANDVDGLAVTGDLG